MTDHPHPAANPETRPETDSADPSVEDATPVTVLRPAALGDLSLNLRIIADADQEADHSHQPVPPVSPGGFPYRYKVRLQGANAYAFTADEVLALFIDGYQAQPVHGREVQLKQAELRGGHCIGVIVDHVAQAMLAGLLDPAEEAVLQRSAEYHSGRDPITADECPRWDHPQVPMLLMGDLYSPAYGKFEPPTGNVKLLWPGRAEKYLHSLAELGLIALSENPAVTATPLVEVRGVDQ